MALVRREPWDDLHSSTVPAVAGIQRQLDELTRRVFGDIAGRDRWETAPLFMPVDVFARGNDLVVRAELPGIDPERDLDVRIRDGMLRIRGERRDEDREEGDHFYRVERRYGAFERVVPLPAAVDEDDIEASYDDGVLEVVIPNGAADDGKDRRIPMKVGQKLQRKVKRAFGKPARDKSLKAKT